MKTLQAKIRKLNEEIEEIRNNKIFEEAFEWRIEFPEVLDEAGRFVGFDCVIGNPPYIQLQKMGDGADALQKWAIRLINLLGMFIVCFMK